MTECEGIGKNVEKAIEDALLKLKADRNDVDIKILETGGLFKKAKVLVTISEDCMEKYLPKNNPEKTKIEKLEKVQEPILQNQALENDIKEPKNVENNFKADTNEIEIGKQFIEGLLKVLNLNAFVNAEQTDEEIFLSINGTDANTLIGYRGDCLNNLQYLLTIVASKNNRHAKHIRLDIDGYREKRKQTLEALAKRVATKVEKTGKQYKLEPMSAYERRIIHTTIQEFENLTSISKGEEPHRYLIVKKK